MEEAKGVVCVTGGTGFQASWLIKRLLERGYTVRTTIRPDPGEFLSFPPLVPFIVQTVTLEYLIGTEEDNCFSYAFLIYSWAERKRDISYLTDLPGAAERLKIFYADLGEPDSFNEAIEGCNGVFHLAFPIDLAGKEPEEVMTKRALEGTLGILKACLNSKTVKRVVYESSQAAVMFTGKEEEVVDENAWSDIDYYRSLNRYGTPYLVAKTTTSKAAVEFAASNGLDLVVLTASFVVGPFLCPRIPESVYMALAMIFGNEDMYALFIKGNFVHTDDVARAFIFLYENPDAKGKYLCSSAEITLDEMSDLLSARYPDYKIPTKDSLKDVQGFKLPSLSAKKLLDSGFHFKYGIGDMFDDAIKSCKEKGFL